MISALPCSSLLGRAFGWRCASAMGLVGWLGACTASSPARTEGASAHDDASASANPAHSAAATDDPQPGGGSSTHLQESGGEGSEATSAEVVTPRSSEGATSSPSEPSAAAPVHDTTADDGLGAYPFEPSASSRGGTMTFTNVGAPGWWPRRIDRTSGDPACDYKDGTDTWGGQCCMTEHHTESSQLAPFDEEMTLILKAIDIKQLAVYQPTVATSEAPWTRITAWDRARSVSENLWFTQNGDGSTEFPGDLTRNDCVGYLSQAPLIDCDAAEYYCPDDPGILHHGFKGSKLVVFLGSMVFDDALVEACDGQGQGHPGPWVAFVASELIRDGGRKWNGACNCYSKTGSVGDGCGEINVFEVVMDDNAYSNREFASTGVRSYQAGHVGGSVCGEDCSREAFPDDVEVVDACAQQAYTSGPELEVGGATDGCPVWRRPDGDRYFFILLDESRRTIQVAVIHPRNIPNSASGLLPRLPRDLERRDIDALLEMRLPQ